jgi:hypothetical protein
MTDTIKDAVTAAAMDTILTDAIGKKWYESKTFWVNTLAAAALFLQIKYGFIIDPASQALGLSMVNLVLRKITKDPVVFF